MRPKTLLVLTILVALLGGFILLVEKDTLSTEERRERQKKVLAELDQDAVTAVTLRWDGQEVRLERRDPPPATEADEADEAEKGDIFADPEPEWHLTAPWAARADRLAVDGFVRSLGELEKKRTLEGVAPADAGLDTPRARVTLSTAGGETVLEVGAEVPASSDMIVGIAGRDELFQVSSELWNELTREAGEWRDKNLFAGSRADIERVTLDAGQKILLARRGEDFWIESPLTDLADGDLVGGLLNEITGLRARRFLDDPDIAPEALGLEPPVGSIEVVLAGRAEPFRIEVGRDADSADGVVDEAETADAERAIHVRAGGQLAEVTTRLAGTLLRSPAEWRSRDWTSIQVFRIDGAAFTDPEGAVEVRREGADWLRGEAKVDYSTVSDALYALDEAQAEEILERPEAASRGFPLEVPALTVTLATEDDPQAERLTLYGLHQGRAAATREGREAVLLLPQVDVDEILAKLAALRTAEPMPEEGEDAGDGDGGEEGTETGDG